MKDVIVVHDPTIELETISIKDVEFGTDPKYKPNGNETKYSKLIGEYEPYVTINGLNFTGDDLIMFMIDTTGFIPKLNISVSGKGGMLQSRSYLKDGDSINILIRSTNPDYKPIRIDFENIKVTSSPVDSDTGSDVTYGISGIMKIPKFINKDLIKSFPNHSSFKVCRELSKEFGLGLQTNDNNTDDEMTWIIPNTNAFDFISNDISEHCYKNDSSFFKLFIDFYYYLNFIEVNQIIDHKIKIDDNVVNLLTASEHQPTDEERTRLKLPRILSNSKAVNNTPFKIKAYTLVSDSGGISFKNAYQNHLLFYDKSNAAFEQFFLESLNTNDSDNKIIMKNKVDVDIREYKKLTHIGRRSTNTHKNYDIAKYQNRINLDELEKFTLVADLESVNLEVRMFESIPVYIFTGDSNYFRARSDDDKGVMLDKFISGNWLIKSIFHMYDKNTGNFNTRLLLTKREFEYPHRNT